MTENADNTNIVEVDQIKVVENEYNEDTRINTCNARLIGEKTVEEMPNHYRRTLYFVPTSTSMPGIIQEVHFIQKQEEEGIKEFEYQNLYIWNGHEWICL